MVDREVLESLYVVNKHAKKYAEQGTENYRKGKKTTAKANSNKKKALYSLKEEVLEWIESDAKKIELHRIDRSKYYCLFFQDFSFHIPIDQYSVDDDLVEDDVQELEDFEKTSEKEHSNRSLKDSLLLFEDVYGLNANDFLLEKKLSWGWNRYFIGWDYLGEQNEDSGENQG